MEDLDRFVSHAIASYKGGLITFANVAAACAAEAGAVWLPEDLLSVVARSYIWTFWWSVDVDGMPLSAL